MTSILEGELAQEVAAALDAANVPYALTVTRTVTLPPDPATPWEPGETIITPYACRGWLEDYSDFDVASTLILASDRKALILIASLAIEPTTTDTLTVDGHEFVIISVKRDPAGVMWQLQARA